ncbi:fasciclin domain-containing protein [Mangrovibacterium sp.]|uniref:fasciclin domain-containing protein n=1 Tax=Mangrovibacterium sp. TaxID=1961364 RepID=UPI00356B2E77
MKAIVKKQSNWNYFLLILSVLFVSFGTVSCDDDDDDMDDMMEEAGNIVASLEQITTSPGDFYTDDAKSAVLKAQMPKFNHLAQAVVKAGLATTVATEELTLFAPTDEAFEMLFTTLGVDGIDDLTADQLTPILLYHVVSGKVKSTDLMNGYVSTINGAGLMVDLSGDVMINNAMVMLADLCAKNGVIHIIDKVLLPPSMNLVETALSYDPEFSILVQAVVKADLQTTLETGGPFTVFAPTNAAFANLLTELNANSLDDIDVATLKAVLLYHVVDGRVFSSDLTTGAVTTLNGAFNVNTSTLKITDANNRESGLVPTLLDVQATNGVIHVIDKVLLP